MNELDLFAAAISITDSSARSQFLEEKCADNSALRDRMELLLAAHFRQDPAPPANDQTLTQNGNSTAEFRSTLEAVGTILVGRYKLLQQIGTGGMGTVWMADQMEPVRRKVAVKLIRAERGNTGTILSRFEAERQAIALMDHPHIAKLLDAGTTQSGTPFFVMELVKGIPLNEFSDAHKLTIPERLQLFVQICGAVHHAHQKGIIHRDLKPTNILVENQDGKPVPKLIDFGLAKATNGLQLSDHTLNTAFGSVLGTPLYMSPEQATFNAIDVDTRADIYALGVILYELLTGTTPITRETLKKAALDEMMKLIREQEAPTPSSRLSTNEAKPTVAANRLTEPEKLGRFVKGELDWIVMKALAKDRDRRYESANIFAKDVSSFLNHEPVLASPPSVTYKFRKFVRRHRPQVIAASLVLLALVGGVCATTWQAIRAEHAREAESEQRSIADTKAAEAVLSQQRAELAEDQMLADYRASTDDAIEELIATKPELGPVERRYLERALARWQAFADRRGDDERGRAARAEGYFKAGFIWMKLGRSEEAVSKFKTALRLFQELAAEYPAKSSYRFEVAGCHINLGIVLPAAERGDGVGFDYRRAQEILEELCAEFPSHTAYRLSLAGCYVNNGDRLRNMGKLTEAEPQLLKGISILKQLLIEFQEFDNANVFLANGHNNLGVVYSIQNRGSEALKQFEDNRLIREKLLARSPNRADYRDSLASSYWSLGKQLATQGRQVDAEKNIRKALEMQRKLVLEFPNVPGHRLQLVIVTLSLADILENLGQTAAGEALGREALATVDKLIADFPTKSSFYQQKGVCHLHLATLAASNQKSWSTAEEHFRTYIELNRKLAIEFPHFPDHRYELAVGYGNLAHQLSKSGKTKEGFEQFQLALELLDKMVENYPDQARYRDTLADTHGNKALALFASKQPAEADAELLMSLKIREQLAHDFPEIERPIVNVGMTYGNLGRFAVDNKKPAEALPWYDKSIQVLRPIHEKDPRQLKTKEYLRNAYAGRADAQQLLGKNDESLADWDRAIQLSEKVDQPVYRVARALLRLRMGDQAEFDPARRNKREGELAAREVIDELDRLGPVPESEFDVPIMRVSALRLLTTSLQRQGRMSEGLAASQEYITSLEKLVAKRPESPVNRINLFQGRIDFALALTQNNQWEKAIRELKSAQNEIVRLPHDTQERWTAVVAFYLGKAYGAAQEWAASEETSGLAIRVFADRRKREPKIQENVEFLAQAYWHRATARDKLKKFAGAAEDWKEAAGLASQSMDIAFYSAHAGRSLNQGGDEKSANVVLTQAVERAKKILSTGNHPGMVFYDAAAVYALAASGSTNKSDIEKYAIESVRLLQRAAEIGFLKDPVQQQVLRSNDDFVILKPRDDFKRLLLEMQSPEKK